MRYVFSFGFALALSLALMAGCSDENGEGGSGGAAGVGGEGGSAGGCAIAACERYHDCDDGNQCTEDAWAGDACENMPVMDGVACDDENQCTTSACIEGTCEAAPVENDTPCYPNPLSLVQGTCTEGQCTVVCDAPEDCDFGQTSQCISLVCSNGICESSPVQNGTACDADLSGSDLEGKCYAGECELPCVTHEDCGAASECSERSCAQLNGGSRCEQKIAPDGTPCTGGVCQLGRCQVTTFEMPCTEQALHNAMMAGCGPYTFDCDGPTTVVTDAVVVIDKDVIVDGEENLRIDGNREHTPFFVNNGVTAELCGFEITGGIDSGIENYGALTLTNTEVSGNRGGRGGGLHNAGTLRLRVSAVVDNRASYRGGGIFNTGTLDLADSTVSNNSVSEVGRGGGIYNEGTLTLNDSVASGNTGGALYDDGGVVTLIDSAVSGNTAVYCGAGIFSHLGALTLTNSTVSENEGCGIFLTGFYDPDALAGTLTLTNSTVSGNTGIGIEAGERCTLIDSTVSGNAPDGGIRCGGRMMMINSTVSGNAGDYLGNGIVSGGTLTLVNSTVSGNTGGSAQGGGGIHTYGEAVLINSTVSGNTSAEGGAGIYHESSSPLTVTNSLVDDDCYGTVVAPLSGGGNIESPGDTCGFDTNLGDQVSVTAEQLNLGPLQDNGGPTQTHALLPGSVAIDQIPEAECVDADGAPLTTDQRGVTRPQGPACDVGAFELEVAP